MPSARPARSTISVTLSIQAAAFVTNSSLVAGKFKKGRPNKKVGPTPTRRFHLVRIIAGTDARGLTTVRPPRVRTSPDRYVQHAEAHRQLAAVVDDVIADHAADHGDPGQREHGLAGQLQRPGLQPRRVVRSLFERPQQFGGSLVELDEHLSRGCGLEALALRSIHRSQIQFRGGERDR